MIGFNYQEEERTEDESQFSRLGDGKMVMLLAETGKTDVGLRVSLYGLFCLDLLT